ncbi:MAG: cytochrome c3 family protein [Desulfobacterales bacterium]
MKPALPIIAGLGLLLFAAASAAQEEVMTLSMGDGTAHSRSKVVFEHERHSELTECQRCHHDYDDYGANIGGEGQPCADCHTIVPRANPISLASAFHLQCKGCHEKAAGIDRRLPVMCGQCHLKQP